MICQEHLNAHVKAIQEAIEVCSSPWVEKLDENDKEICVSAAYKLMDVINLMRRIGDKEIDNKLSQIIPKKPIGSPEPSKADCEQVKKDKDRIWEIEKAKDLLENNFKLGFVNEKDYKEMKQKYNEEINRLQHNINILTQRVRTTQC